MIKNLLLDRDGTIIKDRHYLSDPDQVQLLPGVCSALLDAQAAGLLLFQVSNQSGLGRGYFSFQDYQAVQSSLRRKLAAYGIAFQAELFCAHSPEANCGCRKPNTSLWDTLSSRFGLQASQTAMIGDKLSDLEFGIRTGLRLNILLQYRCQQEHLENLLRKLNIEHFTWNNCALATDLPAALKMIFQESASD